MCVYVEGQVGSGVRGCIYLVIGSEAGADEVNAFAVVLFELTYVFASGRFCMFLSGCVRLLAEPEQGGV